MRIKVFLECSKCHSRNYKTEKNKQKQVERLEIVKFCPHCNERVIHRESK